MLLDEVLGAELAKVRRLGGWNFVGGKARVGGHALHHRRRKLVAGQKLQRRVERVLIGTGPVRVDGKLVEKAVIVNPRLDEKPVGLLQFKAAAGDFGALGVLALVAAIAAPRGHSLGAPGGRLAGAVPSGDYLVEWAFERRHEVSGLEQADVDFFDPMSEFYPLKVILQRLLALAAIPIALRQVEGVARDQEWIRL